MKLRSFEDLDAWRSAHQMTLAVYRATKSFPRDELFGITSQIRRASVSVEVNFAEGFGRGGDGDFARFVSIADGSPQEVKCLLRLSSNLGLLPVEAHEQLRAKCEKTGALIGGLKSSLSKSRAANSRTAERRTAVKG